MNARAINAETKNKAKAFGISALPLLLAAVFFIALVAFPVPSGKAVSASLKTCAERLIPTLFPFAVASELLVGLRFSEITGRLLGRPFSRFFGISECGAAAFVIGSLCGLPLGGRYAVSLYKSGALTASECEKLMALSTNAGIGFTVIGIGYSLWGSLALGWLIYGAQILASVAVGVTLFRPKKSLSIAPVNAETYQKPFSKLVVDAVSSSALNMLNVCAFAVFFSTLSAIVANLCTQLSLPPLLGATFGAFSEIASGCRDLHAFALSNAPVNESSALLLTFFAVGFSGFSVHAQMLSLCDGIDLKMKKYFLSKLASGIVCALTGAIVLHFLQF